MPAGIQQLSADTRSVADVLMNCAVGETVTYSDMSKSIGRDVRRVRHIVYTAMKIANEEAGAIFDTLRGIGYVRRAPADADKKGSHARKHVRRVMRATAKTMINASKRANDMPASARRAVNAEIAAAQLIAHVSRDRSVASMGDEDRVMPVALASEAFLKHIGAR